MKRNRSKPTIGATSHPRRIRFEFVSSTAESVAIAGTFNDWRPRATPMVPLGQGRWAKDLALQPGTYEYQLVVDGEWLPDPKAADTAPNPFGGFNSVRNVGTGD
jgi:1,4-alpha-glucan branching enzyme